MKNLALPIVISVFSFLAAFLTGANAKDMDFRIIYQNHTNVVVADGEITNETPGRFQDFLDTDPFDGFRFVVALNSDGGSLLAGMTIGAMIREWGFQTEVNNYDERTKLGGRCFSACALAFLGGHQRSISDQSTIGFHQFSSKLAKKYPIWIFRKK